MAKPSGKLPNEAEKVHPLVEEAVKVKMAG